jgi:hypothetical protein
MITTNLTGHLYYGSSYESCSNCGTCDGGKCDYCHAVYVTSDNSCFTNKEDAVSYDDEYTNGIASLIPVINFKYTSGIDETDLTVIRGALCVRIWETTDKADYTKEDYGYRYAPCNTNSPVYAKYLAIAKEKMTRYNSCTCTDKDEDDSSCCGMMGCTDKSCYREMTCGKRTEKKWYM